LNDGKWGFNDVYSQLIIFLLKIGSRWDLKIRRGYASYAPFEMAMKNKVVRFIILNCIKLALTGTAMSGSAFRGVWSSDKGDIGNARALVAPRVLKQRIILATEIKNIIDTIITKIK
jgi:hypothetical protein